MTTRRGSLVLAALGTAAAVLIALELALGALSAGEPKLAAACTAKPAFQGGGIDGFVQRFALSALNGAACRLHTTREELVLSLAPATGTKHPRWDRATIERALRAGLDRASRETVGGGLAGQVLAFALRALLAEPLAWFLDRGT